MSELGLWMNNDKGIARISDAAVALRKHFDIVINDVHPKEAVLIDVDELIGVLDYSQSDGRFIHVPYNGWYEGPVRSIQKRR